MKIAGRLPSLACLAFASILQGLAPGGVANADETVSGELEQRFASVVLPFLRDHCFACHGDEKQKADLDLSLYTDLEAVAADHRLWKTLLERVESGEMPPEEARKQPVLAQRAAVTDWIRSFRQHEAIRHAGDPGVVLARRLSNAEYDYTIRDLTGIDFRPTADFPVDPANETGFDNTGESLRMSPALLQKYLAAAQSMADHLVLLPEGFRFAPHPVLTDSDRDKYCVKRIADFYDRCRVDYAEYILAAWRFRHRHALGKAAASLADTARASGISPKYLETLWEVLEKDAPVSEPGPIARLREMWRALPGSGAEISEIQVGCETMRDFIGDVRQRLAPHFDNLAVRGISSGSQPLVLWKNRQYAESRMRFLGSAEDARERAALEEFCRIFPDAFYVVERGRMFLDPEKQNRGRLLSAGFHLMMGYFRDDRPLYELVLSPEEQREIDRLWRELNFVTSAPMRQYKDFVFFERAEPPRFMGGAAFDFARSEDNSVTSASKIDRLAQLYIARAREHGAAGASLEAIEFYFREISAEIRGVKESWQTTVPTHIEALLVLAERAYRRSLTEAECEDYRSAYQSLRDDGLAHEEALRELVASILVSPHLCYRVPEAAEDSEEKPIRRLSDHSLASRLSYFLWSSLPDKELLAHASAGDLHRPAVLVAQARRMTRDDRIRGLATEFGGHWLGFRRFEEHNGVDRERFPQFTDALRHAMFEEPVRFFVDLVRTNGSALDFLHGTHTLVNPVLAQHYEMPVFDHRDDHWVRRDDAAVHGRGGLLPMSVFLTMNAPGRRTSPVKRGYWVVRRLLGERIPAPPPDVPELPADESNTGERTLPQLLAQHRAHASCAACHDRFDSIGLAFEGFGPVGERRGLDLGGRPVQAQATYPDGAGPAEGLPGLRAYLRRHRESDFIDNLSRKLFSYALGRGLLLSDEPRIAEMRAALEESNYRFHTLLEHIVTSPQFGTMRAGE